jgi:ABC-type sugar transport system ATPase subunit
MTNSVLLEMKGISKHFGGLQALSSVNLTLHDGEVLGLVGDNGAGKSTLMHVLSGAYTSDEGEIFLDGELIRINSPRAARDLGIGMIYQDLALVPYMSVWENIYLGNELKKTWLGFMSRLNKRQMREKSLSADLINPNARVRELSGGQRAAVAIARTLTFMPRIVIMDEPTAALAVKEVNEVLNLIIELRSQGISVIIISHRLQDILAVGDRIMVLRQGKNVGDLNVAETTMNEVVGLIVGADTTKEQRKETIQGR